MNNPAIPVDLYDCRRTQWETFLYAFTDELVKLARKKDDGEEETHRKVKESAIAGGAAFGTLGALKGRRKGVAAGESLARDATGPSYRTKIKHTPEGISINRKITGSPLSTAEKAKVRKISRWGGGAGGATVGAVKGVAKGALLGGALAYIMRRRKKARQEKEKSDFDRLKGKYSKKKKD